MELKEVKEWFREHKGTIHWNGLSSEPCQVCGNNGKSGSSEVWATTTGHHIYVCRECLKKAIGNPDEGPPITFG